MWCAGWSAGRGCVGSATVGRSAHRFEERRGTVGQAAFGDLDRQEAIFGQELPPDCTFVPSEACLHRHMGDLAMMVTQLEHLLALSERPYLTILVLPFASRFPASRFGFTFLQFNSATMGDFVSVPYDVGAATVDDEDALRLFQRQWEFVRSAALGEYDSRRFIRRVLGEYQTKGKGSSHADV